MIIADSERPHGYRSHNTGGEHVLKHVGDVWAAYHLGVQYFGREESLDAFEDRITDRMNGTNMDNHGEFVFVSPAAESGGRDVPCGYLITKDNFTGHFEMKAVVEELLVTPDHRQQGLARWMLHKAAFSALASVNPSPTSLTIENPGLFLPEFADSLRRSGFVDDDAGLTTQLPGRAYFLKRTAYEATIENMPEGWNGMFEVFGEGEQSGFIAVFRDGTLLAKITRTKEGDARLVEYVDGETLLVEMPEGMFWQDDMRIYTVHHVLNFDREARG